MTTTQKLTIHDYAMAYADDIGHIKFQQVEAGQVKTYYAGTVFGQMVGTSQGLKFDSPTGACDNALLFVDECIAAVQAKREEVE